MQIAAFALSSPSTPFLTLRTPSRSRANPNPNPRFSPIFASSSSSSSSSSLSLSSSSFKSKPFSIHGIPSPLFSSQGPIDLSRQIARLRSDLLLERAPERRAVEARCSRRCSSGRCLGCGTSSISTSTSTTSRLRVSNNRRKGRIFASSGIDEGNTSPNSSSSSKEVLFDLKLPRRSLIVQFTCNACGERTERTINKVAYERGTVFVQCAGCRVNHKLVDNLGLVVEYDLRKDRDVGIDSPKEIDAKFDDNKSSSGWI